MKVPPPALGKGQVVDRQVAANVGAVVVGAVAAEQPRLVVDGEDHAMPRLRRACAKATDAAEQVHNGRVGL